MFCYGLYFLEYLVVMSPTQPSAKRQSVFMKFHSYDHFILDDIVKQIVLIIKGLGGTVVGPIPLPKNIKRVTVNASPHVNAKSKEQYEIAVHSRGLTIVNASSTILDKVSKLELPAGVGIKVEILDAE